MESCISDFVTSITSALVLETVKELRYYCCQFNNLVEDLQAKEDRLAKETRYIQDRVHHAKRQAKKTEELVLKLLEEANRYTNNADGLLEQARTNKSCCFGQYPNWIWRYNLGHKLAGHIKDVEKCIEDIKPYLVGFERSISLLGLRYLDPERCFMSKNRKYAYQELMEALKSDEVNTIGLYGMEGCGKTKFAKEFGREVDEDGLFNKVLYVEVPDDMRVRRIQEMIASCLSYDFRENEEMQRAERLFTRLAVEEKVLVIMDNVRGRLDFEAIGIPSSMNHKGCKVLITSGSEEVCIQNDCQKKIRLSMLDHEEAWSLFQIEAFISEESSDTLKRLAREVSDECDGLLVAIIAMAGTLKGKTEDEWNAALHKLRSSEQVNIGIGLKNPYDSLRLTYDNLDTEAQSLFLLCAVFPQVSEIPVENLIRFAIGLGLVGDVHTFERSRYEVNVAKNKLISSCLLSDSNGGKSVKMHGLVRTVALLIEKNENKVKCLLNKDVSVKCGSIRYLWCKEFPNELDCSSIEFLCMKTDLEVPDEIFEGMVRLRVLFLCWEGPATTGSLSTMSFKRLTKLRCLSLERWKLGDLSFVGYMTKLESLTLLHCSFYELPHVIATQLKNLRLLHLSECDILRNPFELIGRQQQLEELYIEDSRPQWDLYNESAADNFFNKFSVPQALKRYHIQLGSLFADYQELLCHVRTLLLSCFDTSNPSFKNLAKRTEVLFIANIHGGAKNIIPNIFQVEKGADMNDGWTEVLICDSEGIEHLVDTDKHLSGEATLLSKLRKLRIERMERLQCLYHGWRPSGLFKKLEELYIEECPQLHGTLFDSKLNMSNLKTLELYECPKLTFVFTPVVARSVVNLESLEILYCDGLKHVLADDHSRGGTGKDDFGLLIFQKLKLLTVRGCKKIEYIIPVTFAQGLRRLECLEIEVDPELEYLFGPSKLGANQSQNEDIELPLLNRLILLKLPKIISIVPRNCHAIWPSLCQFILHDCPEFNIVSVNTRMDGYEGIQHDHNTIKINCGDTNITAIRVIKDCELSGTFQVVGGSIVGEQDPLTTRLQKLSNTCNALMQPMNLQNLEQMELSGSKEFSSSQMDMDQIGLPQLKKLSEENYNQGDQRFNDEDLQHINLHLYSQNQLQDLPDNISIPSTPLVNCISRPFNLSILKRLMLRSCSMLRTLFSPSSATCLTSLEELLIADCHGLRYVVTCECAHEIEEEIIADDSDCHQNYASTLFPRLKRISVANCNLLEYVLHVCFAQGLVELKRIEIYKAPQLRYLFGENIHDDDHVHPSQHHQNNIQIELPVLENVALFSVPNMINICPDNYYCTCSSLLEIVMENVGMFTLSVNNLMVNSGSTNLGYSRDSTLLDTGATNNTCEQLLGSISIWNSSEIKGIFHLDGFPNSEQQVVNSWLIYLHFLNLPELRYIWNGAKHFVTLQNLSFLLIRGCQKLKVIFSTCVVRSIPQLKVLVVQQCDELEQIIEEDEDEIGSYPQSKRVSFSKLKLLIITHCNKLKHIFYISTSHEFPELEYLIVYQNPLLEEVFEECGQVPNVEVLLPELKNVALMQLPNLNNISQVQGIDCKGVTNLLVHNCPKLALTSTTTVEYMLQSRSHDKVIDVYVQCHLIYISYVINEENAKKDHILQVTCQLHENHQHQLASNTESMEVTGTITAREATTSVKPTLQTFGSEIATSTHNISSSNSEHKVKESIQEVSTSGDTTKAVEPAGTKGNSLGVSYCQNLQNVDDCIQEGSTDIHQSYPNAQSNHSLLVAKLGAFKHFADLDDTEIALLAEAMEVYPHLWKVLDKFSERYQTLMLKTLADMLFFLRNESAASVTTQQKKEFLRLCDEAIHLGFEKSWIEEISQRVVVNVLGVHHAQSRLNELHHRHDQLAQELYKIEDEIDSLTDFIESHKKCFDFL